MWEETRVPREKADMEEHANLAQTVALAGHFFFFLINFCNEMTLDEMTLFKDLLYFISSHLMLYRRRENKAATCPEPLRGLVVPSFFSLPLHRPAQREYRVNHF